LPTNKLFAEHILTGLPQPGQFSSGSGEGRNELMDPWRRLPARAKTILLLEPRPQELREVWGSAKPKEYRTIPPFCVGRPPPAASLEALPD